MAKEFFGEINPNIEIIQVIKAADQLYYKDKTLYTFIKPELIRSGMDRPKDAEKRQQKQKSGKEKMGDNSETMIADKSKQSNEQREKSIAHKNSKLQEMIGQAKQTVRQALGSSHECQQSSTDKPQDVSNINGNNEDLVKLINALEQRLKAVEELTEGIAKKIGYSK